MAPHRLFCTDQMLLLIIEHREERPYNSVYAVIDKLSDIYIETANVGEFLDYTKTNPILKHLAKRPHREVKFFDRPIEKEIEEALANDIFLLLPPESNSYVGYREKRGLLVTYSLPDLQVIDDLCRKHFRPYSLLTEKQINRLNGNEYEDIKSWKEVFDTLSPTPINSAIIIDNYIFAKNNISYNKYSLYSIIKSLVKSNLQVTFHLTIFTYNENGLLKKDKIEQVIKEIHDLNLGLEVKVSIVVHMDKDEFHDRMILTNYHRITSGIGFSVINSKGVIQKDAEGDIIATFHNIENLESYNSMSHKHAQMLCKVKHIYDKVNSGSEYYGFIVGDTFNNRLISN